MTQFNIHVGHCAVCGNTCQKQGFDPEELLKHLLHSAETLMADLVATPTRGATLPPAIAPP